MRDEIAELLEWLQERNKSGKDIKLTTDLIEEKVIDSLTFVEYVMMIEEVTGQTVVVDDSILTKVNTLAKVEQTFFTLQAA
jgi:acyl carrier protein